ncbi:hypothetical protein L3X65_17605 [Vibrio diabolicus]|uniref:hypothetical protein n=1 Tax=Vibrio diabolicus TaxID=50719 RepID=UPI00211AB1B2|nr:hypothetical protein [Vibrio diabolicus]MCG9230964.1 hypothetical protein [Vibrio diabolicus]MCG9574510.1 hypothetical protein [Vibrio diabolicus]MCG9593680.1 hypothetical protein [Vibrio diabolicus]MCZ0761608.1 hypothetical protein [Vibrio diabolicus]
MGNFIQLAAAFGVGGLLVKLIDIFVLQPFIVKKELNNWLRDKKLVAYSAAVEDLANMGFKNEGKCPFEDLGSLSQTLLLVESTELQKLIDSHMFDRAELHDCETGSQKESELFDKVDSNARQIISALRDDLRKGA